MSIKNILDNAVLNTRNNLRYLLSEGHLSISALASLMRMSKAFVSRWLTGDSTPSLKAVIAVCQIFDVKMDEFCLTDMTSGREERVNVGDITPEDSDEALVLAMFRSTSSFNKETVIRTLQAMCSSSQSTIDLTQSVFPPVPDDVNSYDDDEED